MTVRPDLIYDVGASFGDDSAYYLSKGFNVLAVEANPLAVAHLNRRFDSEIHQGRFTLAPVAVAESEGTASFWICDDEPERSSFDRSLAAGNGMRHHSIEVQTTRFGTLIEKFGTPSYCKIDIEGCDGLCLRDLTATTRPAFISAELLPGDRHIETLSGLGYARFKILSQRTFRPPNRIITAWQARLPSRVSRKLTNMLPALTRYGGDGTWQFSEYSSGPFGSGTCGRWLTAGEALGLQRLVERNPDGADWYDVHAALDAS
jgi:FkbM family methyltransferase